GAVDAHAGALGDLPQARAAENATVGAENGREVAFGGADLGRGAAAFVGGGVDPGARDEVAVEELAELGGFGGIGGADDADGGDAGLLHQFATDLEGQKEFFAKVDNGAEEAAEIARGDADEHGLLATGRAGDGAGDDGAAGEEVDVAGELAGA